MGQILVRNVSDWAIDSLRYRAKLKGTSLEQEARELIEAHAPFTPEERVAACRDIRSMQEGTAAPLTLDEIRQGLE
jgi:plasmid stability protein